VGEPVNIRRSSALIALVMLTMATPVFYLVQIWPKQKSDHEAVVFRIAQGASLTQVADELAVIGLTDSPVLFRLYARISGSDRGLRAGTYKVPSRQNARELIALFSSGKVQQHAIRLPEGMNLRVVMALLAEQGVLKHRSMGWQHLQDELDLDLPFAEGAFFPDTYFVPAGATDLSVLQRAHDALLMQLQRAWRLRADNLAVATPAQALILASIIEKESDAPEDRRQISQVFHLRLKKNMKLQTDPTVIYALGENFDGDIRRRDLRVDSPFNTYRYKGLPPTPIALPSLASIQAAVNPADGDYLYFVARGDGTSQFSRTLEEHNAAVRRYQLSKGGS
jgi:UPF0755 protein